jgi:hypothetical protein
MHPSYGEDRRSRTNAQCLDRCDHLVPARGNSQLAFPQVEALSGDPQRLAFGGTTTTCEDSNRWPPDLPVTISGSQDCVGPR